MTKAYWIGHVSIDDAEAYEAYRQANAEAFLKFGGRFLVRGGAQDIVEGEMRPRCVVIEFPSLQAARDCYHSAEYQRAKAFRDPVSDVDLVIVEGWTGDS
ncbi:DUF1330 domain-containing protein [Paracoccus saliphilus]|uniref:DUF1330 domain-containing protein n=1 Tax=Paracoccus saliphilus TaxID=405559 RepID=A0AA46A4A6_9RHOB|nr:DUF1330 domain-containing protein [Paracoccus saliphilus]WCR03706.1 DUF1330 domain-containing protein [Paracoccus saliphilus]SIS58265.1 Uncharacterized conserved protein, DUF1330 family [Paracoccus saliphilus]